MGKIVILSVVNGGGQPKGPNVMDFKTLGIDRAKFLKLSQC